MNYSLFICKIELKIAGTVVKRIKLGSEQSGQDIVDLNK
jgi:hypothetical protein